MLMLDLNYLSEDVFTNAISSLPLVSIDLCIISDGDFLLGKRLNRPAKDFWFSPGGRIRKNEPNHSAIKRIANDEIGYSNLDAKELTLMGVWDHFYSESAFDENIPTHYVNLPYYLLLNRKKRDLHISLDNNDQHSEWTWMPLNEAANHPNVHQYVRQYASWLINYL
jgi:colanic acid biosynthesis protein WcaH